MSQVILLEIAMMMLYLCVSTFVLLFKPLESAYYIATTYSSSQQRTTVVYCTSTHVGEFSPFCLYKPRDLNFQPNILWCAGKKSNTPCSSTLKINASREHESKSPAVHAFTCWNNDKCFSEKKNLRIHVATVHEKRKAYKCTICSKDFQYTLHSI